MSKPKVIGMILDKYYPPDPRVENEAQAYLKKGYEVKLWCLDITCKLPLYEERMGIKVYRYHLSPLKYKFSALAYTFPFYRWILRGPIRSFLSDEEIDIIHVHDMQIAATVFDANEDLKLPYYLDLHEDRPEIMKYYPHVNAYPGKLLIFPSVWAKAQIELVRKADKVIVVTEEAKERIVSLSGIDSSKVESVPNTPHPDFYDKAIFYPEIAEKFNAGPYILYLGDTGLRRGLDTAMEALKILEGEFPTLELIVVGSSRDDDKLHKIAEKLQLGSRVYFEGWQDQDRFPSYIKASDIGISPLHRNPHHDTTYANKIFQYMAFDLPVIVSDCPAQANVIRKRGTGLIHEAGNAEDLANKIRIMLSGKWKEDLSG